MWNGVCVREKATLLFSHELIKRPHLLCVSRIGVKIKSVLKFFESLVLNFTTLRYAILFLNSEIYIVHVIDCEWSRFVNFPLCMFCMRYKPCFSNNMFMHESFLLVCRPYFNTMKSWTSNPNLHLSSHGCWYCILSTLDLHAGPQKIQKYYYLSIGLQEHPEWRNVTRSDIGAPEVPLLAKMTKMPLVNARFDRRSNKGKTLTKQHFS